MNLPVRQGFHALTEKEKQTLRLIVRGHDAKSIARSLGLSVHTINERLRDARRKMAVSNSREAARLLLAAEGGEPSAPTPESCGDNRIGEDAGPPRVDREAAPVDGVGRAGRRPRIIIGAILMTLALGLLLFAALPGTAPQTTPAPAPVETAATPDAALVDTARRFLTLLDESRWDDSYRATGAAFRKLNTARTWTTISEKVRAPLGAATSRTFVSQQNLPAPPAGYEVLKFRTRFANGTESIETVTLEREQSDWRVVGVTIG